MSTGEPTTPPPTPPTPPTTPAPPAPPTTPAPATPPGGRRTSATDWGRLVGAAAYVPTLCFLPYFLRPTDSFARAHGRQAFMLLFCAAVLGLAMRLLEWAVSPVPVIGIFVQVVGRMLFAVGLVLVSGLGALRALTGERVTLRLLAAYADRLPL